MVLRWSHYYLTILVEVVLVKCVVGAARDIFTFVLAVLDSLHILLDLDDVLVGERLDDVLYVEGRLVVVQTLPVVYPALGQVQLGRERGEEGGEEEESRSGHGSVVHVVGWTGSQGVG